MEGRYLDVADARLLGYSDGVVVRLKCSDEVAERLRIYSCVEEGKCLDAARLRC